jgi:hypothetical protein
MLALLLLVSISSTPAWSAASLSSLPTGYTVSGNDLRVMLTYHSRWNSALMPVYSGDSISGDHIILNATWLPLGFVVQTKIEVNATAIPSTISNETLSTTAWIDTRGLGNNATCVITVSGLLYNGTSAKQTFTNVFLGNFFVPHVRVISPNGGEHWTGAHNITWFGWSNNSDEQLTYEVLLSSDSGTTFQLLSKGLNNTWFTWYTQGFLNISTYVVEVRVFDGIYTSHDTSDGTFSAGDIPVTTTATTTVPDHSLVVALFISAAIISCAIMSLIVYYAAKRWY